ncbi:hypothetical protein DFR76_116106, partial [Nocardia pseudobrasiliensis]
SWLHTYNHHRGHTALGGQPPASRITNLSGQYSYSSVSAFSSAFRSWKGQSPGAFARVHRGRVAVPA